MRPCSFLIPAAAMAVTLFVAPQFPATDTVVYAQTAEDVSLSVGDFYNDLSIFGDWIAYQGTYVFVPRNVDAQWSPYTLGHWVYFDAYGWLWVSDEPFGWATYHYGRWGHSDDIGWYWVPGRRWAPAWVSWRRSGNFMAWAPLPPGPDSDIDTAIVIPVFYFIIVPARFFLDVDLDRRVIVDDRERSRLMHEARPLGRMMLRDNVMVNNGPDVGFVEKETKRKVEPVVAKEINDPRKVGKGPNGEIAIFPHDVKSAGDARPGKIGTIQDLKRQQIGTRQPGSSEAVVSPRHRQKQLGQPQMATRGQNQPGLLLKKGNTNQGLPEVITPPARNQQSALRRMKQPGQKQVITPDQYQAPAYRMVRRPPYPQAPEPSQTRSQLRQSKILPPPRELQLGTTQGRHEHIPAMIQGQRIRPPAMPGRCNPLFGGCG